MKLLMIGLFSLTTVFFLGCGPDGQLSRAQKLENKGKYYKAWERYQMFVANYPQHPKAAEALFHAGWLAESKLNDCYMAGTFYSRIVENYPQSKYWARAASLQKGNCPDYFPLHSGSKWVVGDSDTKGKNARIEVSCSELPSGPSRFRSESGQIIKSYFAGRKKTQSTKLVYKKKNGELLEYAKESDSYGKLIMKWPLDPGTKWRTKKNKRLFNYNIVKNDANVKVKAGRFKNCILVQSSVSGVPGVFTNEYYAPGVGLILTSISTRSGEKRITELLSYSINPSNEFIFKESAS